MPKRSFFLALIVGTVLNLINHGEILFGGGKLNLIKIFLTYAVPYCVATYGAAVKSSSAGNCVKGMLA